MKKFIALLTIFILISSVTRSQIGSWERKLEGRSVWSLGFDGVNGIYAGGLTSNNSRIWKSTNAGSTWDTIYIGSGQTMWDFAFNPSGHIYVANYSTGLLKSTDNGASFTVIPSAPNFNGKNLQGVKCGAGGFVYVTTSTGFFRSTDNGATFTETALTGSNCLPVIVDKDSSNIIYVGVTSATGSGIGVYRSTDNGLTFGNNLLPNFNGYNLIQTPNGDLYRITTTSSYPLARSTNKGLSWTSLANLPSAMRGITYYSFHNEIFTAGNGGVFISSDSGQSFTNLNFTISSTPILNVQLPNEHITLTGVSGTANGGVWIYYNNFIQEINSSTSGIGGYLLEQNYPNPFNPETKISFTIPKSQNVEIILSDIAGKEVAIVTKQIYSAGNHTINLNAKLLPSGAYFYTIMSDDFIQTKKMVLLK